MDLLWVALIPLSPLAGAGLVAALAAIYRRM